MQIVEAQIRTQGQELPNTQSQWAGDAFYFA
jgi:hypothetical protein